MEFMTIYPPFSVVIFVVEILANLEDAPHANSSMALSSLFSLWRTQSHRAEIRCGLCRSGAPVVQNFRGVEGKRCRENVRQRILEDANDDILEALRL